MPRVKRGMLHTKRRRNLMKRVKGFEAGRKNLIKLAQTADMKAGAHAYRDRRVKKRLARQVWQIRINAAARNHGMTYSTLMGNLKKKQIELDRKVLSEMAVKTPKLFTALVESVK